MSSNIKILQIVDSLDIGGAERMCVNIANTFSSNNIDNILIVTRPPLLLLSKLNKKTRAFVQDKKSRWDFIAFIHIHKIVRKENPTFIHAHSTTVLWACFLKILNPGVKLIWHDHYGNRAMASDNIIYRILSLFMFGIITVNDSLTLFHQKMMFVKKRRIRYIPNFPALDMPSSVEKEPNTLIINANFIPVKNHLTLLKALVLLKSRDIPFTLFIIGKEFDMVYTYQLKEFVEEQNLTESVIFKGQISNIEPFLAKASIGILTSKSEGLPVSLLEYGLAGLAVISTNVGQCPNVLGHGEFGWIVSPENFEQLADILEQLLKNPEQAKMKAKKFQQHVSERYSDQSFLNEYRVLLHLPL